MYSIEIRKMIIDSNLSGHTKKEIAAILNIKLPTVYAIIQVYQVFGIFVFLYFVKVYLEEGRMASKLKGGVRRKALTEEHVQFLRSIIDEDAGITLTALRQKLIYKYNVTF